MKLTRQPGICPYLFNQGTFQASTLVTSPFLISFPVSKKLVVSIFATASDDFALPGAFGNSSPSLGRSARFQKSQLALSSRGQLLESGQIVVFRGGSKSIWSLPSFKLQVFLHKICNQSGPQALTVENSCCSCKTTKLFHKTTVTVRIFSPSTLTSKRSACNLQKLNCGKARKPFETTQNST